MITEFLSRDVTHWFGNANEALTGAEYSHGGIRNGAEAFEHRLRAGIYPWAPYETPKFKIAEWRFRRVSDQDMLNAYCRVKLEWTGKFYGVGQLATMLSYYLWLKVGVKRKAPDNRVGVCTELLYCLSDAVMGDHHDHLHQMVRSQNQCGTIETEALYTSAPELYERIR